MAARQSGGGGENDARGGGMARQIKRHGAANGMAGKLSIKHKRGISGHRGGVATWRHIQAWRQQWQHQHRRVA
jgi:hypothetical protein